MSLGELARFFPHRHAQGGQYAGHALAAQPVFRMGDQRMSDLLVLRLEQAPIAGAGPHALFRRLGEREVIDVRGNAPDGATVLAGDELGDGGVLEERVLARGDELDQMFIGIAKVDAAASALPMRFALDRNVQFDQPLAPRPVVRRGDSEGDVQRAAGHRLTDPVQAGVMTVMAVAETAKFSVERLKRRVF